jgi:prevent-host-death family protein
MRVGTPLTRLNQKTIILVMNKTVTFTEAKAHISALVTDVANGGEVTITRHGRPVARLVGAPTKTRRTAAPPEIGAGRANTIPPSSHP